MITLDMVKMDLFDQKTPEQNYLEIATVFADSQSQEQFIVNFTSCSILRHDVIEWLDQLVPGWHTQPEQPWQIEMPKSLATLFTLIFRR